MKKYLSVFIVLITVSALFGCSSVLKSVDLRLSGKKITPVFLPDSSLLASSDNSEASETESQEPDSSVTMFTESDPAETEPLETLPQKTDPPETEPSGTPREETDPTETLPPATRLPETVPSETKPHRSVEPTTTPTSAPKTTVPSSETEVPHPAETVKRIEILTLPDKTLYDQYHEAISAKGLTLMAYWEDGYEKVVTEGYVIYDVNGNTSPVTSEEGEYTIFVRYGNQTAYFTITFILAENAPLQADGCFHAARKFYVGEYLRHICLGAWLGDDYIPGSELTFSQERLDKAGLVTVTVSWKNHKDERTFAVLPRDQYELTMEDLEWLSSSDDEVAPEIENMRLSAAWFYERLLVTNPTMVSYRPLPSDIIDDEEFIFDPPVLVYSGVQKVQVTCRGLSYSFWIGLYFN